MLRLNTARVLTLRLQFNSSNLAHMLFKAVQSSILGLVPGDVNWLPLLRIATLPYPTGSFLHDEVFEPDLSLSYGHSVSPNG